VRVGRKQSRAAVLVGNEADRVARARHGTSCYGSYQILHVRKTKDRAV
jgi:hypothetical protein